MTIPFRLDDLLRQKDEQATNLLDDLLGKPPSTLGEQPPILGEIAAPLTRPMARDVTTVQPRERIREIRAIPEAGGLK